MSKVNEETDPSLPSGQPIKDTVSDADWHAIQEETSLDILTVVMDVVNNRAGASRTMERIADQCTAAFRRGLSRATSDAWADMSTAPKDETSVLLWWPYWSERAVIGYYDFQWRSEQAISDDGPGPTKWQPLPAPPVSTQKKEVEHEGE